MKSSELIGQRVMMKKTHSIGVIVGATDDSITVDFYGDEIKYPFPDCFSTTLELEDEEVHQ